MNDTYGHNAGDAVLQMVGASLKKGVQQGEVFRWGGEEFIILLPGSTKDAASMVAETLRATMEQKVCNFDDTDIRITMSFGVNALNPKDSIEANIEVADAKLYEAKTSGRNRVVS